jgi:hypothetical protein
MIFQEIRRADQDDTSQVIKTKEQNPNNNFN